MTERTLEDRARLVNRYWPMQYRVASRFILGNWDYEPQEYCPTCGTPEALTLRSAPVVAAELRRIADETFDCRFVRKLHARADELDPPARKED